MFTRHRGTTRVPAGTYLCLDTGEWVNVPAGSPLPGSEGHRFIRMHVLTALILGPLSGLLFVLSLPLLVPAFLVWRIVRRFRSDSPRQATPTATVPTLASPPRDAQPLLDPEDSHQLR